MMQILLMSLRNLGRNRRRSLLSALAIAIGLALLIVMAAVIAGEYRGAMENTIQLQTGHLQIRAKGYSEEKLSLDWKYLVPDPAGIVATLEANPLIVSATPRLYATGIVSVHDQSRGVEVMGIDPASVANAPFQNGVLSGSWLSGDDREGCLMGYPLASKLKLAAGDTFSLLVNRADGSVDQQLFTLRGTYTTNNSGFDEGTLLLPLAKAQTFTQAGDHASTILVFLKDRELAEPVAASISASGLEVFTWQRMNELILSTQTFANDYIIVFYLIVLGITATIVTNTLVMAVFERTREIGILSAIGMSNRRIMWQFLVEGALLATGGLVGGLAIGFALVAYFSHFGIFIGSFGISGMLLGDRIYAYLQLKDVVQLALLTYVMTLIASLYPAQLAAGLEPVHALHG